MSVDPGTGTPGEKLLCGAKHSKARLPEQRKDCGGSCLLEAGEHNWHMCNVCIEYVEPPDGPSWKNHEPVG